MNLCYYKGAENAKRRILFIPCIKTSGKLPNDTITFSKAMSKFCKDFDKWVVFYELDEKFERLWNNPKVYLNKLKNSAA